MKIAIASDAWEPQVNGVVRTLRTTAAELARPHPYGRHQNSGSYQARQHV